MMLLCSHLDAIHRITGGFPAEASIDVGGLRNPKNVPDHHIVYPSAQNFPCHVRIDSSAGSRDGTPSRLRRGLRDVATEQRDALGDGGRSASPA